MNFAVQIVNGFLFGVGLILSNAVMQKLFGLGI